MEPWLWFAGIKLGANYDVDNFCSSRTSLSVHTCCSNPSTIIQLAPHIQQIVSPRVHIWGRYKEKEEKAWDEANRLATSLTEVLILWQAHQTFNLRWTGHKPQDDQLTFWKCSSCWFHHQCPLPYSYTSGEVMCDWPALGSLLGDSKNITLQNYKADQWTLGW